jgi:4-amino-4-deoxy-L-arabinose transferase-like glycosyltransferase
MLFTIGSSVIRLDARLRWRLLFLGLLLLSVLVKLAAAQNMPWDIDYVPVIERGWRFLQGDMPFPAYGTLSSVAAYNMPFLVWLHLPALALTNDVFLTILITMMSFHLVGSLAVYRLGEAMFGARAGFLAGVLFTWSSTGISGAYTAWAQHLLPGFFVLVLLCLWEWQQQGRGIFLAAAGVLSVAAFMTHFAAVLLFPAMLVFALLTRARWQWGWLAVGTVVSLLLLSPYVVFQVNQDFADIRAFLSQENRVPDDILDGYEAYNRTGERPVRPSQTDPSEVTPSAETNTSVTSATSSSPQTVPSAPSAPGSTVTRIVNAALDVPGDMLSIFNLYFIASAQHLTQVLPVAGTLLIALIYGLHGLFWVALLMALWQAGRAWWQGDRTFTSLSQTLTETAPGRVLLVFGFCGVIAAGIILTRNVHERTYYLGFASVQWLPVAYALHQLATWLSEWRIRERVLNISLVVLMLLYAGLNGGQRLVRLHLHDDSVYSRYNIALYRHVDNTVDYIASDWDGDKTLSVRYDIFPEMQNFWWVAAWHEIDPFYRIGMNFDFLLEMQHGLHNTSTDRLGETNDADYTVVYQPGLTRYDLSAYEVARFGAIYVLKPVSENPDES